MDGAILWAAVGTGFTFLMTSLGSAMVFFFKSRMNPKVQRIMLGFAAGVMIAAAVWSLLVPAIEEASANGQVGWVPAAGGMALGVAFLMLMDSLLPHLHVDALQSEGLPASFRRTTLLVLAVTLHNIPEGMAVGLSFARAAQHTDGAFNAAALALALVNLTPQQNLDAITIGTLMVLVPGRALTNAMWEIMAGDIISGVNRTAEALLTAAAIALGVVVALAVGQ